MNKVAWDTCASKDQRCGNCQCVLTVFTGMHLVYKGRGRKLVCGSCAAQLELNGWSGVVRSKEVSQLNAIKSYIETALRIAQAEHKVMHPNTKEAIKLHAVIITLENIVKFINDDKRRNTT